MKKTNPVDLPLGYIDFFKDMESWENTKQILISKKYSFKPVDIAQLLIQHKQPLLQIQLIKIDDEDYKSSISGLLAFLTDNRSEVKESLDLISTHLNQFNYAAITKGLINDDKNYFITLAQEIKVSFELLLFVLDHGLRPFLRLFALPYQEFLAEDRYQSWDNPTTCPICGAKSHICRLRAEDGRRFMFCDRCFSEWEARYLECVHCANNEPGSLRYISVEGDNTYQIYVCDKCKGYLKTFDERVGGMTTDLFIANMETIYLDLLAQEHGYKNDNVNDKAN